MSGWDTSSRPIWDPEGEPEDSTQPDRPETSNDPWPEYGRDTRAQGGYRSPGAGQDHARRDRRDYEAADSAPKDLGTRDWASTDWGAKHYAPSTPSVPSVPSASEYGSRDARDNGSRDYASPDRPERPRADRDRPDRDRPDRDRPDRDRPDWDRPDWERPDWDRSDWDRPGGAPAGRDYGTSDYASRDAEPDRAARRDPALQDFFVPPATRRDAAAPLQRNGMRAQSGPGQDGQPPPRPGQPRPLSERHPLSDPRPLGEEPGQPRPPGQFSHPDQADPLGPPRPLSRPAQFNRQNEPARHSRTSRPGAFDAPPAPTGSWAALRSGRPGRRERYLVGGGIALLIVLGLVAYMVGKGSTTATGGTGGQALPLPSSTGAATNAGPTPSAKATAATKKPAVKKAVGYTLTTAAVAGGYPLMSAIPAYVQGPASTTAAAIRSAAVSDGGKVTGKVSAAYQLSGGQVMAFTGYKGTFSPTKVVASLATLGTNGNTYPAGKDGGKLACAVAPGTQPGTVCVWVTSTTLGITEFFSASGPEEVTNQAKTASDTRNFRAGVEHRQ